MSVIVDLWLWTYFICKVISSRCCCAIINVKATLQECSTKKVVPRQHLRETFNFCSVNPFDATDLSLNHPPTPPSPTHTPLKTSENLVFRVYVKRPVALNCLIWDCIFTKAALRCMYFLVSFLWNTSQALVLRIKYCSNSKKPVKELVSKIVLSFWSIPGKIFSKL